MEKEKKELIVRDWLAIERTHLANERTFLAYFRTAMVFLGTGIGLLKIDFFAKLAHFGVISVCIAPVILLIGLYRLIKVRKLIKKYYDNPEK